MSATKKTLDELCAYESRNVTFMEADGSWPIVWERARGTQVWDADGKKYLDLTAAFGVAACGHANPRVVRAGQAQLAKLPHAMGDVHPHRLKAELARELSRLTFERWDDEFKIKNAKFKKKPSAGKTIFCNSGFEAVEAALKTALLATGRTGVIAFKGGYHGLGYGALNATHREHFRAPFVSQLGGFVEFADFPVTKAQLTLLTKQLRDLLRTKKIGAILVEPVQARGGINIPTPGFLPLLRKLCDEFGAVLVLDEIYTGFGRTGKWFACDHSGTVPDLICLGKALTGGFPLSACAGRAEIMDAAWPVSNGEAIHTSTFLGNPVGCAMALAQIAELHRLKLIKRSAAVGDYLIRKLKKTDFGPAFEISIRGVGLMVGLELRRRDGAPATVESLHAIKQMLHRGFILLPEGADANVISFTPPLTITRDELKATLKMLRKILTGNKSR